MKIAFVGNFSVPFSTESHHRWTWTKLGHQVVPLQENQVTAGQIAAACEGVQVLAWTHTHGWGNSLAEHYQAALDQVHARGVNSFSYHLDVYRGLNVLDHREDLVGKHPSWKVQHFFSTDGSDEEFFKSRGVNHHWLPPGIIESECFYGVPHPALVCDVAFVGSLAYHPEYQFRLKLSQELRKYYGPRFRVFQGYRGRMLNDVYASAKVVVGDHCFAGRPRYWSDRVPETCGRGGFMVYPRTEGLEVPLVTYEPQNVDDLIAKVDDYLKRDAEREEIRRACHEWVKAHDTYTHRLRTICEVMGLA